MEGYEACKDTGDDNIGYNKEYNPDRKMYFLNKISFYTFLSLAGNLLFFDITINNAKSCFFLILIQLVSECVEEVVGLGGRGAVAGGKIGGGCDSCIG